jgi:glycosyltransferase involved in cell wall biosynthesis
VNRPLISIVMPCFNARRWVRSAIGSLLSQTYANFELIVVDDGSEDGSWEALQAFAVEPRVRLFRNEKNNGQSAAANRGYAEARGDYIKFFDADDLLSPDFLEAQVNRLAGRMGAVASAAWGRFYGNDLNTFRPNPESVWRDMEPADWLVESWMKARPMMQCALWMIPREILEETGTWNEELSLINDFEFFARVLCHSEKVMFCPEALLHYRSGLEVSLSGSKSRKARESECLSLLLGTSHLLARRRDPRAKRACANVCQHLIYDLYPEHEDLAARLAERVEECGGSDIPPSGGRYFHALRPWVGWKVARRLQRFAGK